MTLYAGINAFVNAPQPIGNIFRISDNSDRIFLNPNNTEVSRVLNYIGTYNNIDSGYALDYYNDYDVMIAYNSGYTTAQMPQELKWIVASMIKDLISLMGADSSGKYIGIYQSEGLGDYNYKIDPEANLAKVIDRYSSQLDYFKKKVVA
jgi:hypothetical protein